MHLDGHVPPDKINFCIVVFEIVPWRWWQCVFNGCAVVSRAVTCVVANGFVASVVAIGVVGWLWCSIVLLQELPKEPLMMRLPPLLQMSSAFGLPKRARCVLNLWPWIAEPPWGTLLEWPVLGPARPKPNQTA